MNASLSMCGPRCSNRLDIVRPDSPNGENGNISGMGTTFLVRLAAISPLRLGRAGIVLPAYFVRDGLCSNVSTWLTPPDMKRKMQRLAVGRKCGFFGVSGLAESFDADTAARASSARSEASARVPMPLNEQRSSSRRESTTGETAVEDSIGEIIVSGSAAQF